MFISQVSKLAEDKGGRLCNMFFVYNRINTTQKEKLSAIIHRLASSMKEAFDTVENLTGNDSQLNEQSRLKHFRLDATNSSASDVRFLGDAKVNFVPPDDVPDLAYGEALAELREHIHQRVVTGLDGETGWQCWTFKAFSEYLQVVWKCITK